MKTRRAIPVRGTRAGQNQRGFALLVVFLMAAAVAFSLYTELPRVGFESARAREQLLMDRGNQFKRAIEVFYAVNKKYPATIEDLEKSTDRRFLRHRYKDPLTGKDEWRLIHTNGSFLTDSLVKKPPAQNAQNGQPVNQGVGGGPLGSNTMNTAADGFVSTAVNAAGNNLDPNNPNGQQVQRNIAAQRRPSDLTGRPQSFDQGPSPQDSNTPMFPGNPQAFNANDPSTWPPIGLAPSGQQQQGQGVPQNLQAGQPGNPFGGQGNPYPGQGGFPNTGQPGFPNSGGNPVTIPGFGGTPQINVQQSAPLGNNDMVSNIGAPLGGSLSGPGAGQDNSGLVPQSNIPGQLPGFGGQNPQGNPFPVNNPLNQQASDLAQQQMNQDVFNQNPAGTTPGFNNPGFNQLNNQNNFNNQPLNNQAFNNQAFNNQPFNNQPLNNQPFGGNTQANPIGGGQNVPAGGNRQASPGGGGTVIPGFGGTPGGGANSGALGAINGVLSGQNANGLPGGNATSPGIAGVASKFEGPSIKSYGERLKYQEWEFVFDPSANQPAAQQQNRNPLGNGNTPGNQNPNAPGGTQNPFGGGGQFNGNPGGARQQPNPMGGQAPQGNTPTPFQSLFGPSR
ncbi:MAG: hypothetical protein ABL995_05315 [Bryobacteraceae bacterium]